MFTNEFKSKYSLTTILDNNGVEEDVQMYTTDSHTMFRQFNPETDEYEYVTFTLDMWRECLTSLTKSEGFFK